MWVVIVALVVFATWAVRRMRFWQARELPFYRSGELFCLAHRGIPSLAPENTLPAFREAVVAGVDGIELDVLETADGVVIVRHDFDLERTTDGEGYVWERSWDEISRLNAAYRRPEGYPPTPVPRLDEVLALIPGDMLINIEIKSHHWHPTGIEAKVVELVGKQNLVERTMISSFNPLVLLKVRRLEPRLALALIWWDEDVPWLLRRPRLLGLVRPDCLHPNMALVTPEVVNRAHRRGMRVNVWTVNNRPMIEYLRSIGVDGIFTDFPELVAEVNRAADFKALKLAG